MILELLQKCKTNSIFSNCFLACLVKKKLFFHWEISNEMASLYLDCVQRWRWVLTSVCVSGRPSAPSTHVLSAWHIYVFSTVCLCCSELLCSFNSWYVYCIYAGRGIRLQIYLLSDWLQQETETVKEVIQNAQADGSRGGLTPTYVSGMLQLWGGFDIGLGLSVNQNYSLFQVVLVGSEYGFQKGQ